MLGTFIHARHLAGSWGTLPTLRQRRAGWKGACVLDNQRDKPVALGTVNAQSLDPSLPE